MAGGLWSTTWILGRQVSQTDLIYLPLLLTTIPYLPLLNTLPSPDPDNPSLPSTTLHYPPLHTLHTPPGLPQLLWWLAAWRLAGLQQEEEGFDVVVMVHPHMVEQVLTETVPRSFSCSLATSPSPVPALITQVTKHCTLIGDNFTAKFLGQSRCFYKPYEGESSLPRQSLSSPQESPTVTLPSTVT